MTVFWNEATEVFILPLKPGPRHASSAATVIRTYGKYALSGLGEDRA